MKIKTQVLAINPNGLFLADIGQVSSINSLPDDQLNRPHLAGVFVIQHKSTALWHLFDFARHGFLTGCLGTGKYACQSNDVRLGAKVRL